MVVVKVSQLNPRRIIFGALSDATLTKKASLNALSSLLDYLARFLVAFLVTPIILAGLGSYSFGMWQILMRAAGYLSPASGRATEALKWTLANRQTSTDYEEKRRYVGRALLVWLMFLPLMLGVGGISAWFLPYWFDAPPRLEWPVRLAFGLLVLNMALTSLTAIPQSVLQGENLAYKRMGLSALFVVLGGGFTWLAVYLGGGLPGIAAAVLLSTLFSGGLFFMVARTYTPWFGIRFPSFAETRSFLSLSFWFLVWHFVVISMVSSDVIVLGLFASVNSVGDYTLTRYAPETVVMLIAVLVFGITPGLGGIIGSGDRQRAARVRAELMSMTWLLVTAVCTTILFWNRLFVSLWVGDTHYLGTLPAILIVAVVLQFIFIRNDSNIIDLTLNIRWKVLLGFTASTISIVIAIIFVEYLGLGVVGLCLGLLLGRSVLSVAYPAMIGRFLGLRPSAQAASLLRPCTVTAAFFLLAVLFDAADVQSELGSAQNWLAFLFLAALTCLALLPVGYYAGLSSVQRARIAERLRILVSSTASVDGEKVLGKPESTEV